MGNFGKFSTSDLKKLQNKLNNIKEQDLQDFMEDCAKKLAAMLLAKVTERTPTGKKPKLEGPKTVKVKGANGKTRTVLSPEAARLKQYWSGYVGGTLKRGWIVGDVKNENGEYKIELINPVEYASYVEYGHRQTPGRYVPALGRRLKRAWARGKFMLTISEKKLKNIAPNVLAKEIEKFLKDCIK